MPSSASVRRQRAMGGGLGVALLLFALVYHFFPNLLHVTPHERQELPFAANGTTSPMGFERRPRAPSTELDAGPPLALAPRAVIDARELTDTADASGKAQAPDSPEMKALLDKAAKALAADRLVGGADSATQLYMQALKLSPDNTHASAGLDEVQARLVSLAERDLAAGDADAADQSIAALAQLPGSDADVARLRQSLQSLQQVRPLLAEAATLLQQDKALLPKGDNALALYRKVMSIDPGNTVASQGIEHIQRGVLDTALGAVAQEDFAGADAALAQAAQIAPDTRALQDTRQRIEGIRRQRATAILEQARTALDAGNLTLATQLKGHAISISADVPGIEEFNQRLANAHLYASYKPGQSFTDRFLDIVGQGPAMVVIPTGTFQMGSADGAKNHLASEGPQHKVRIGRGFAIGRSEVTVAQFREFVRASGYVPESVRLDGASVYDEGSGSMRDDSDATWEDDYAGRHASDTMPVVNVSWNDAEAYTQWLSKRTGKRYRLPSEAEFEYGLRAGTVTPYWWGAGSPASKVENLTGSGDRSAHGRRWTHSFAGYRDGFWGAAPIQSFAPNGFGLYDMGGNVSEWTLDCWHDNYTRAPADGSAWINPGCTSRVLRGGAWGSSPEQDRSAFRLSADADARSGRVGFRVAREL